MKHGFLYMACVALVVSSLVGFGLAPGASAADVTIQPPEADASLDENSPRKARGTEDTLIVRSKATGDFRVLVQFDLSSIPPGTPILNASLEVCLDRISGGMSQRQYDVYRVLASWVEEEVTAKFASAAEPWATFFGDIAPTPSATVAIAKGVLTNNPNAFMQWPVTADVQEFVNDPTANHGWLIRDRQENGQVNQTGYGTIWVSRESVSTACGPDSAPRLVVTTP
jgi:hypothetical protein